MRTQYRLLLTTASCVAAVFATASLSLAISTSFNVDPFGDWCERLYNMRWTGTDIYSQRSNCCVDATTGGNNPGCGAGCGTPPGTVGGPCTEIPGPPVPVPPTDDICEEQGWVQKSTSTSTTGSMLITRVDDAGFDRTAQVEFTIGADPLISDPDGDHAAVFSVVDEHCIAGIEAFVRRDQYDPDGTTYQLQMRFGGGDFGTPEDPTCGPPQSCECVGANCHPDLPASDCVSTISPSMVFGLDETQSCTLRLRTVRVGTITVGGILKDRIQATARISGPCVAAPFTTPTTEFQIRNGWYNANARRFAIVSARGASRSLRFDNFSGSAF